MSVTLARTREAPRMAMKKASPPTVLRFPSSSYASMVKHPYCLTATLRRPSPLTRHRSGCVFAMLLGPAGEAGGGGVVSGAGGSSGAGSSLAPFDLALGAIRRVFGRKKTSKLVAIERFEEMDVVSLTNGYNRRPRHRTGVRTDAVTTSSLYI